MEREAAPAVPDGQKGNATDRPLPTCRCGHDRHHTMVSPSADYTMLGWAFILVGVSWAPRSVAFVCRTCEQEVERIFDRAEMETIRLAG